MKNKWKSGLVQLGGWMRGDFPGEGPNDVDWLRQIEGNNGWFTPDMVRRSLHAHGNMLKPEALDAWLSGYPDPVDFQQKIGCILAGNLPMVGWMDLLTVVVSGHCAVVKCSSSDAVLLPAVVKAWGAFDPRVLDQIQWTEGLLKDTDAVLATGSNNSRRYFEHYFREKPHLIRHQRTGVAFLDGRETDGELKGLAEDALAFYGLGCRSTTKVFVPEGFDVNRLFQAVFGWSHLAQHNKFANNYDYHKAVWLLNQEPILDNGFLLMKEDPGWVSPVGTLFWESYSDEQALWTKLNDFADQLQCITARESRLQDVQRAVSRPVVPLGSAQFPTASDYPDGLDTMNFLLSLSSRP